MSRVKKQLEKLLNRDKPSPAAGTDAPTPPPVPQVETPPPAAPPVRPSGPAAAAPRRWPVPEADMTLDGADLPGKTLPFTPGAPRPDADFGPSRAPVLESSAADQGGMTLDVRGPVIPTAAMPFFDKRAAPPQVPPPVAPRRAPPWARRASERSASPAPPAPSDAASGEREDATVELRGPRAPSISLEAYAALCAELSVSPAGAEAVFAKYGLEDPARRSAVDATYREGIARDPELRRQWENLYRQAQARLGRPAK